MSPPPSPEEDASLARYAVSDRDHGGRIYPEPEVPYRTAYQRDRDRIIHSKAFRRLGYKTQVFVNTEGDNYRTRLTHSIEVGQIARSVAGALRLNRDYAEALALAHDLGHTPFGHSGQNALHELMKDHGGFEHNRQSLRIVADLETRYPELPGLNLTRSTLAGMMKHSSIYECDAHLLEILELRREKNPYLEATIVDLCDRIAYIHHDLEDGLDANILEPEELFELAPWKDAYREAEKKSRESFGRARLSLRLRATIRRLMNRCITDLIESTHENLQALDLKKSGEALDLEREEYPVRLSATMTEIVNTFHKFLFARLYRNPRVSKMSRRGETIIEYLFQEYLPRRELLPEHFSARIPQDGAERVISDYISGMTDRFAFKEYRYLSGISE